MGFEELGYENPPRLAQMLDLPVQSGLLIAQLYRGSPADQVGLRGAQNEVIVGNRRYLVGGDILTAVDGLPFAEVGRPARADLEEEAVVGQEVSLAMIRNGEEMTFRVTLADTPESVQSR